MPQFARNHVLPLGVVVRRLPGVTRWARWSWQAVAVLPGAAPAEWKVMREDGDATEYHAATLPLHLYAAETEAYVHNLMARAPAIYVILRERSGARPLDAILVTASPYEAQDYGDSGEDLVEKVPMPPSVTQLVEAFVAQHHEEEEFVKRRRDRVRIDGTEAGKGDVRIAQTSDVYRAPTQREVAE